MEKDINGLKKGHPRMLELRPLVLLKTYFTAVKWPYRWVTYLCMNALGSYVLFLWSPCKDCRSNYLKLVTCMAFACDQEPHVQPCMG